MARDIFVHVRGMGRDNRNDRNNRGVEISWDDAMDKLKQRIVERFSPDTHSAPQLLTKERVGFADRT